MRESLRALGASLPDLVTWIADDPATVALAGLAGLTFVLAVGTFLVSRETGGAFAILAAATVGWFLFPYAEIPWATVLTGTDVTTVDAPTITWWLAGAIVLLATLEVLVSAREHLLTSLGDRSLPVAKGTRLHHASRRATIRLVAGTALLGTGLVVLYALTRDALTLGPLSEPDLLWVPVVLGVVIAAALWYSGRDAS